MVFIRLARHIMAFIDVKNLNDENILGYDMMIYEIDFNIPRSISDF